MTAIISFHFAECGCLDYEDKLTLFIEFSTTKSRIQETLNLSMCADSKTYSKTDGNKQKGGKNIPRTGDTECLDQCG